MNVHKQEYSCYYIHTVFLPTNISNSTAAIITVHLTKPIGNTEFEV